MTNLPAVEIDPALAQALTDQFADRWVTIVQGDSRAPPFPDRSFVGVVCFTMLHHVPSAVAQDRLLSEAFRVLRPGGVLAGSDSLDSLGRRTFHAFDTYVPVAQGTFAGRLAAAGFAEAAVQKHEHHRTFRFSALRRRVAQGVATPPSPLPSAKA